MEATCPHNFVYWRCRSRDVVCFARELGTLQKKMWAKSDEVLVLDRDYQGLGVLGSLDPGRRLPPPPRTLK